MSGDKPEFIHIGQSSGPCEVHGWPTVGMPARLVALMRERHGKGGLRVCKSCLERAHAEAKKNAGIK